MINSYPAKEPGPCHELLAIGRVHVINHFTNQPAGCSSRLLYIPPTSLPEPTPSILAPTHVFHVNRGCMLSRANCTSTRKLNTPRGRSDRAPNPNFHAISVAENPRPPHDGYTRLLVRHVRRASVGKKRGKSRFSTTDETAPAPPNTQYERARASRTRKQTPDLDSNGDHLFASLGICAHQSTSSPSERRHRKPPFSPTSVHTSGTNLCGSLSCPRRQNCRIDHSGNVQSPATFNQRCMRFTVKDAAKIL